MAGKSLRICVLASGSKGNAIYLEGGGARVLIDAGLCGRELTRRMAMIGADPADLNAILVTHDHRDHTAGVGVMARRHNLPVYTACGTIRASERLWGRIGDLREIEGGTLFAVNDLQFYPFSTPHDAGQPLGFIFRAGDKKGGIATDLGYVTRLVRESLRRCNLLVVESNHDEQMLFDGPYPWHLKQRIRGKAGHLSNSECAELVDEIHHDGLEAVILAHLSEINNRPDTALGALHSRMAGRGTKVSLAWQDRPGEVITV